jgi:hypothetical protein
VSAFTRAAAALMANASLAESAEWWPARASKGTTVRAVFAQPSVEFDAFGQAAVMPSLMAYVPASFAVQQGDRIRRGNVFYPVRDVPRLDDHATQWECALGPAGAT